MNFNEKLSSLRKAAGISQDTLAQQLGVSRQAISKWELGTAMPETKNIVQLAEIFDVTTDYLLGYTSVPYPNLKGMIKNNTNRLIYWFYICTTILFLICCMKSVIHLAREIIWTVRPLAYISFEEWKTIAWSLGLDNLHFAVLYGILALILLIIKLIIRKIYGGGKK